MPRKLKAGYRGVWAIALALLFAACGGADPAPVATVGFSRQLASDLQSILDDKLELAGAPGATLTVVYADGRSWAGAAGLADKEHGVPVKPDDRFRVGSITKTFNMAVCMQLAEEGAIGLNDDIDKWVPGFDFGPEITLHRVLNHTSGVFNYTDDGKFAVQPPAEPEEVVQWALDHGPVFAPGTDWSYSNTGFFLSGLVIEAVDGNPFHRAVRERLLDSVGLENTYLEGYEQGPAIVDGYAAGVNARLIAEGDYLTWAWAAGAMVSNGADLCKWAQTLLRPESEEQAVLTPESRKIAQTRVKLPDGSEADYGVGLHIRERAGRTLIGHTGSTIGFNVEMFIDSETGTCAALLTNDFLAEMDRLTGPIWERLAGEFQK